MGYRHIVWITLLVLLTALSAVGVAGPATARLAGGSALVATHAQSHGASAQVVPCGVHADDPGGLCLNRNHCGTALGTSVIVWTDDNDSCEDFFFSPLPTMCGHGYVTQTCPFTVGSGLNARYYGSEIVAFQDSGGRCLATDSGGLGILGACPDNNGNGGWNGTIFVWNNNDYVINRYWSDYNYSLGEANQPSWMCDPGTPGQSVFLYDDSGSAGSCQWT